MSVVSAAGNFDLSVLQYDDRKPDGSYFYGDGAVVASVAGYRSPGGLTRYGIGATWAYNFGTGGPDVIERGNGNVVAIVPVAGQYLCTAKARLSNTYQDAPDATTNDRLAIDLNLNGIWTVLSLTPLDVHLQLAIGLQPDAVYELRYRVPGDRDWRPYQPAAVDPATRELQVRYGVVAVEVVVSQASSNLTRSPVFRSLSTGGLIYDFQVPYTAIGLHKGPDPGKKPVYGSLTAAHGPVRPVFDRPVSS